MKLSHKNIVVDFNHESEDFNGACTFHFNVADIKRYISENEGSQQANELQYELDNEEEMSYFYTTDTDLAIYIFYWMLFECSNDTFELDYYGESPFWLFHDIAHAENDVTGGVLYVNEEIEEQRIFDGLKALKKADMMEEFKPSMFESIVEDFRRRWNYEIDTKKILRKMGWKKRDFSDLLIHYAY